MSRKILGLDIRGDSVTAILVNSSMKGTWIEGLERIALPGGPEGEGFSDALETIAEKFGSAGVACIVSLPADRVSFRNMPAPFKDKRKLRMILPGELETTVPFPVDQLVIDFNLLKLSEPAERIELLAGAVETEFMGTVMDTLAPLGIDPEIATVGGLPAALGLARFANVPDNFLFLDVDARRCAIFLVLSEQIAFVRSFIPRSADNAARTETLCHEIQRTLTSFETYFQSDIIPGELRIGGYGAESLPEKFESEAYRLTGIPARRTNLIVNTNTMIKRARVDEMPNSAILETAFSLVLMESEGLKGLNFRTGPFAQKRKWAEHKSDFLKTGILACLLFMLSFGGIWMDTQSMEKKLAVLNNKVIDILKTTFPEKSFPNPLNYPVQQMKNAIAEMEKANLLPPDMGKRAKAIDILNDISKLVPEKIDVEFTQLVIEKENVAFTGNTDAFDSVNEMQSQLEKSELFRKVTIISSEKDKDRVAFKLKIQL